MQVLGLTIGDWRCESTLSSQLLERLKLEKSPGMYVLSARACGWKGMFSGARHSWVSIFDGMAWTSIEITDEETLTYQKSIEGDDAEWVCFGAPSKKNQYRVPFRSNRAPDGLWFGQEPRLEAGFSGRQLALDFLKHLDDVCAKYKFKDSFTLLENNCSKFISYLLWKNNLLDDAQFERTGGVRMIGFRDSVYWRSVYEGESMATQTTPLLSTAG